MPRYEFFLASSLEKVFPTRRPDAMAEGARLSVWPGARCAVQLVYTAQNGAPGMPMQRFAAETGLDAMSVPGDHLGALLQHGDTIGRGIGSFVRRG